MYWAKSSLSSMVEHMAVECLMLVGITCADTMLLLVQFRQRGFVSFGFDLTLNKT